MEVSDEIGSLAFKWTCSSAGLNFVPSVLVGDHVMVQFPGSPGAYRGMHDSGHLGASKRAHMDVLSVHLMNL